LVEERVKEKWSHARLMLIQQASHAAAFGINREKIIEKDSSNQFLPITETRLLFFLR
jgi:hypothetical protein